MAEEVTAANPSSEVVTEAPQPSGELTPEAGSATQDSTATKLQELESRLAEYERTVSTKDTELKAARELAAREEGIRKGLQKQTTDKLQELADLKRQLANQDLTLGKLDRMERLVNKLAETQLDPETVSDLNEQIEREKLRQDNERLKQQLEARDAPQQQQQGNPLDNMTIEQKQQLIEYYFPSSTVTPDDPRIDWATNATTREEWFRRTSASVRTLEREAQEATLSDRVSKATEESLREFREEQAKVLAEQKAEIERLKSEQVEVKRVDEELANRSKGMDREDRATPQSTGRKSIIQQLNDVPDAWAKGTPEQRVEHAKRMRELRAKALKGFGNI